MVVIHFKRSDMDQFRYETTIANLVADIIDELVTVNNMRVQIDRLACGIEGLADHGPLRPEALRGLTMKETLDPAIEQLPPDQKHWAYVEAKGDQQTKPDKTGYRIGVTPCEQLCVTMKKVCTDAKEYISKHRAEARKCVTIPDLKEHLANLRGVIMMAYPGYHGLPEWDQVHLILEDKIDYLAYWPDSGYIDANEAQTAWFSGRELDSDKTLADNMTGKPNEKATIILKLTKKGEGAPVREAPIDKETHKEMLAYYYKKQEEAKALEQNNEDDYMNSVWADPSQLKKQLHGQGNISWK